MSQNPISPILFVDLDNTLTRSDLFLEPLLRLIKNKPMICFLFPFWLIHGRAYFKQQLSERIQIDVADIPFDEKVKKYLSQQRKIKRKVVLATASNQVFANQVADHLGLFDDVIASTPVLNTKGKNKLIAMKQYAGDQSFDYLGDSHADIHIWQQINRAIVVSPQIGVLQRLKKRNIPTELIHPAPTAGIYLKAMRPWQWSKNTLIFVPLILAKQLFVPASLTACIIAFISFCLVASAGYLVNDLLDLESDRKHPRKRNRPIAAGELALWNVVFLAATLMLTGLFSAWLLSSNLALLLLAYFVLVITYSLELKKIALIDVIAIAGFYATRIIASSLAMGIAMSFWLLAFSIFMFFSLALLKRCTEILTASPDVNTLIPGRGYYRDDEPMLSIMGISSGYLSVVVIALYINSTEVVTLYQSPQSLWLVCPLMLYWISHMWLKVRRNEMDDDPLVFALKDKSSLMTGFLLAVVMLMATLS